MFNISTVYNNVLLNTDESIRQKKNREKYRMCSKIVNLVSMESWETPDHEILTSGTSRARRCIQSKRGMFLQAHEGALSFPQRFSARAHEDPLSAKGLKWTGKEFTLWLTCSGIFLSRKNRHTPTPHTTVKTVYRVLLVASSAGSKRASTHIISIRPH